MHNLNQHNTVLIQNINIYNPKEHDKNGHHRRVKSQSQFFTSKIDLRSHEKLEPYFSIKNFQTEE